MEHPRDFKFDGKKKSPPLSFSKPINQLKTGWGQALWSLSFSQLL
ncbi:hypothetical protein JMA_41520 (plasmid) [Jeotgalibacillus malaysiensis]|uniref:Uncharacterized protein n=1 Tax=Jeotgalibacillus malaysiensis TaxID=1508404 RepID=A0A0B5AZV2_9BACL|nr:hypothetical protein JMA_41520 [Jeotgalibacillus malaysiensis]